jgi:hypothetical protein
MERLRQRWSVDDRKRHLAAYESASEISALRRSPYTGRPLGSSDIVAQLERATLRALTPSKGIKIHTATRKAQLIVTNESTKARAVVSGPIVSEPIRQLSHFICSIIFKHPECLFIQTAGPSPPSLSALFSRGARWTTQ